MWSFDGLPLVTSIGSGDPSAGVWIFNHPDLVPDDATNIEFVENQSCTPLRVAIDGRGIPTTATRRTNAFTIEIVSNVARRPTGSIRDEDASHDGRFLLDNLEFPWPAGNRAIAVSPAAGMAAIADYARHSTAHLLGAVFALHLAYKTSDTNQDRVGGAVMDCLDFDPLERKSLVKPC
jgi:hypothetical protein